MSIVYNNPEYNEQRKNVVPLDMIELSVLVAELNDDLPKGYKMIRSLLQRLIWSHENMQHAIQTIPKWVSVETALPEEKVTVLLLGKGNRHVTGMYKSQAFWSMDYVNDSLEIAEEITHWTPILENP